MKRSIFVTLSVTALALASCGKKDEPIANNVGANAASPVVTEAPAALSAGQVFANAAAASDAFEIESSRLAATSAASASTKAFAQSMIKGHTDSTAKLKKAAAEATPPLTPDPTLAGEQLQTLEALKGKEGAAFDAAYADAQTKAHEMTLTTLRDYATAGDVPSLKAFAAAMVPIVTAHVNMAKGLGR
ncbi:DUF4142 domain-containing protein [Sphingobium sp. AN558]|uniref:DUF4142 domain-containing protein n=1 Tax=Sphingobium sp. AN558 TaxID=3133442 RepID=UPI0030BA307E